MWDIVYYLAGVGMIGTVGYGLLYILDSKDIKNNIWASKSKICFEVNKKFNLIEIDNQIDFELIKKIF